jgi:DNA-binding transcriptional ArsR family regulator
MTTTPVAQVFQALGDKVRLEMVQRLSRQQPCTIDVVSRELGISRQGARKHLQVLVDAKLVVLEPHGREVRVQLAHDAFAPARAFIEKLERDWDRRLEALRRFVEQS